MDTGPRSLLPMLSMASQLCSNRRMLSPRTQSSVLLLSNSGLHYSALSPSNVDQLQKGMQSSIEIQRAILRQGSSAITKTGFIQSAKKFWWVKLDDSVDMSKLCHPQALTKFGFFLIDAPKELGARMKPLICACLAREPEKVLVVGVCGKTRLGLFRGMRLVMHVGQWQRRLVQTISMTCLSHHELFLTPLLSVLS